MTNLELDRRLAELLGVRVLASFDSGEERLHLPHGDSNAKTVFWHPSTDSNWTIEMMNRHSICALKPSASNGWRTYLQQRGMLHINDDPDLRRAVALCVLAILEEARK